MRIMFAITRGDVFGGAQSHVRFLVEGLIARGHDVSVVTGSRGVFTDVIEQAGARTFLCDGLEREISPAADLSATRHLIRIVRAERPDLLTVHTSKAGIVGRIAAKVTRTPCVYTVHGWNFINDVSRGRRTFYTLLERTMAPLAARIICVSDADTAIARQVGIASHRLVRIFNGVPDLEDGEIRARRARQRQVVAIDETPMRVAMIARFHPPKDQEGLLRAAQPLSNVVIDFIGDGPTFEAARDLARDLGMTDRVVFHGARSDIPELLDRADVLALISNSEGFALTPLEGMRSGLPVVASNVGGMGEAVIDGVTGFLVPKGDPTTLGDRLRQLAADPQLRSRMGAAGRSSFCERFTAERMIADTEAIFTEAAGRKAATPATLPIPIEHSEPGARSMRRLG